MHWVLNLLTQLGATSNYIAIANHTLQITAANIKSTPARSVFNNRFLVTNVNNGYSWNFRVQVLPVRRLSSNWTLSILPQQKSQSQSHVTTDGQLGSLSWNKVPIWELRPDFYYCQTVAGLLMWGALSDERAGVSFTIAPGPCQCRHFRVWLQGTRDHNLLSQIRDFPFRRLLRITGLRWRYSTQPSHGYLPQLTWVPRYIVSGRTKHKTTRSTVSLLLLQAVA
jgi:hypothetical protein